ncbi:MAG: C-terminal binding protein [Salinigranum sp.]
MSDRTVLVTDHHFGDLSVERDLLDGVATVDELDPERADRQFAGADAVLTSQVDLDAERIETMQNCRVISRYGIGVDNVDVEAATEREIHVGNAPTYGIEEVAVHTVALLLNLARRIKQADAVVARGGWREAPPVFRDAAAPGGTRELPVSRVSTETVGFVGFGNIGRAVCELLSGFGVRVLVFDPYLDPGDVADADAELADFETVTEEADYLTIHSPLTAETRGLVDRDVLARMKDSAFILNCARGAIVDEDALVEAVDAGEIEGAAIDVFPEEPLPEGHPLRDHERVITTPHVAYYSEESDDARRRQATENVLAVLRGEAPPYPVNRL